jgi:division protein CdvB (Snf7/Vps24/ESCRT-III family)
MKIDYTTLEDEAKDVIKNKDKASVLTFGAALMNSVKDVMPAYGVKASWTDATEGTTHNVFSEYGLATTAIKPLSYAFLKDFNANLPGEDKLQEIAGQIIDKISDKLKLNLPDFSKYDPNIIIKDIVIDPTNPNVTVTIQGTLKDADGNDLYILVTDGHYRYYMKDETDPWVYNLDLGQWQTVNWNLVESVSLKIEDVNLYNTIKYVADQINARYGSTSPLADLLNDVIAIGDLNATIQNAFNDVKSEVNGLITKAYNKLNSIFSKTPNKALQPVLIGKSGNKIGLLSKSKKKPTKVNGSSLTLIPTSYTLELVAPAYKKYIVVSDVFNADGSEAAASLGKGANGENMAKVIDSEKTCTINGQSGYIYEISYNAVDYHGKIVNKRFYVQF